jgi:xanthine permease XanP
MPAMMKKPPNLLYGVDEKPPLWVVLLLGVQHIGIIAIGLIFPVVVVQEMGGGVADAARMVSISMIAAGIGVMAQAWGRGAVGSGYLCPQLCGPSFLGASILAAKTGGLSLVFGMTALVGLFEMAFSRLVRRLRVLFPAEVTGLIVMMVGISVTGLAVRMFFGAKAATPELREEEVFVAVATLAGMIGMNVWSRGRLRLFCILIGMGMGYGLSFLTGVLAPGQLDRVRDGAWLASPLVGHPGWSFQSTLVVPFLIAIICSTLKSVGDLTTCQKINDPEWKRPDLNRIGNGILANSFGVIGAGLLGGMGQSASSANVGLSVATGATSRVIAYAIGGLLFVLAFCPKLATVFAIMPAPVMGATLIFALSFMVIAGIQIIMSRMLDARRTFVVGIPVILGIGVDVAPEIFHTFPHWLQPVFHSSLSTATILAILLNLIFRIGITSKAGIELGTGADASERLFAFMQRQGGLWGARKEVIDKAAAAADEFLEVVRGQELTRAPVLLEARFDEYRLDLEFVYAGRAIEFPDTRPEPRELLEDPQAMGRMAGYLVRRYTDKLDASRHGDECRVKLSFEH